MKIFKPTYLIKNTFDITVADLKKIGVKSVFSDLDNTLVAWNNKDSNQKLREWLSDLKSSGIQVVIISNNTNQRVARVADDLNVEYQAWSLKPLPRGIKSTIKKYNLQKNQVIMLGDQIMTDVIAANLSGVRSILVKPLVDDDGFQTVINRFFERIILKRLKKQDIVFEDNLDV